MDDMAEMPEHPQDGGATADILRLLAEDTEAPKRSFLIREAASRV